MAAEVCTLPPSPAWRVLLPCCGHIPAGPLCAGCSGQQLWAPRAQRFQFTQPWFPKPSRHVGWNRQSVATRSGLRALAFEHFHLWASGPLPSKGLRMDHRSFHRGTNNIEESASGLRLRGSSILSNVFAPPPAGEGLCPDRNGDVGRLLVQEGPLTPFPRTLVFTASHPAAHGQLLIPKTFRQETCCLHLASASFLPPPGPLT